MNNLLQLKGRFEQAPNSSRPGLPSLPKSQSVQVSEMEKLRNELQHQIKFWSQERYIDGALVSVYYNKVAAKSNRIKGLLSKGQNTANRTIVGARFTLDQSPKHIITHYVSLDVIEESIKRLDECIQIVNQIFQGSISHEDLEKIKSGEIKLPAEGIRKTNFTYVITDVHYIEKFDVFVNDNPVQNNSIITIFQTDHNVKTVLEKIGLDLSFEKVMDETTIQLRPDELALLRERAPYLISMAVSDISRMVKDDFEFLRDRKLSIPPPNNEPTIGVIDTMFDESVYFSEWVSFESCVDPAIQIANNDFTHGTAVTSIIVDGPSFNRELDDGCGRFRVRHFGVATGGQFSSFSILRNIRDIVRSNTDIKVWNLSLGSMLEINPNFISPEAAFLDKLQFDHNIIFVIAGTNQPPNSAGQGMAIGAPADSINSLVVNAVSFDQQPASYSRSGPVLSFFTKPDISYYGGDRRQGIRVCTPVGEAQVCGTSYAAPWISRKMSYLIDILGFNREVAKALLIHSATGWSSQEYDPNLIGHGIVPIRIEEVTQSQDDEIQFILDGTSEKYDTYNFNIPVPVKNEKHPFIAKATLCYFPCCSRNQGVDYTNTELDLQFGRITQKNSKTILKPINNNYQGMDTSTYTWEEDARKLYRKWDNVKHIREVQTSNNREKKRFDSGLWGISLKTKERLEDKFGEGIKFGVVVSLKSIDGVNRINEFIKNCYARMWLVNVIEVQNRVEIYNIAEQDIEFQE